MDVVLLYSAVGLGVQAMLTKCHSLPVT